MGKTLTEKILMEHLVDGTYDPGNEIGIKIDQTLTQDATGTMAYLQFESMGLSDIATELSVSYVDHNTIQVGFENADDHAYLESIAKRYGIYFSRPGNGICHQVHLERFARPGKTLLGSDSHTPTAGGVGCIAIGAGGLDVAGSHGRGLLLSERAASDQRPSYGRVAALGDSQGRDPRGPETPDDERKCRLRLRIHRRRHKESHRS